MNKPFGRCYWVEAGRLLAGCYPGAPTEAEARKKLGALLDAGVRTFVNLMEPAETNWEERPFVPYAPLLEQLAAERGVDAECLRYAVRDQGVPEPGVMEDVLAAIENALAQGRTAYVHCWGGRGRTGTAVGCWLIRRGLATPEDFVYVIRQLRADDASPGASPENEEQVEFVRAFSRRDLLRDRYRGCLIGLAVGDALGTTLEFMAPGSFTPIADMVGRGPFGLKPGEWTDDTSMALCLAESLIERGGFDPGDQMKRYVKWWKEGHLSSTGRCFDIGNTVRGALGAFMKTSEPFSGGTDTWSAGNGSLMRLAPVPLAYANAPEQAVALAGESSRTTHNVAAAVDACRYMAGLIVGALRGESKQTLLSECYAPCQRAWLDAPLCPEIEAVARGSFQQKEPPEIRGTGYVVDSLEAALWAFDRHDTFREGCLAAVNLGNDADTTGAIYGQLAGAYYGLRGIPKEWVEKVAMRETVRSMADELLALSDLEVAE